MRERFRDGRALFTASGKVAYCPTAGPCAICPDAPAEISVAFTGYVTGDACNEEDCYLLNATHVIPYLDSNNYLQGYIDDELIDIGDREVEAECNYFLFLGNDFCDLPIIGGNGYQILVIIVKFTSGEWGVLVNTGLGPQNLFFEIFESSVCPSFDEDIAFIMDNPDLTLQCIAASGTCQVTW